MRCIPTAIWNYVLRERNKLLGAEECTRDIDEPCSESHRSVAHRGVDECAHLLHFRLSGVPVADSHDGFANGARADISAKVDSGPSLIERIEISAERGPWLLRIRLVAESEIRPRGRDFAG